MKFQNIGGATGILEHDGIKIFFDPWLDEGIYQVKIILMVTTG